MAVRATPMMRASGGSRSLQASRKSEGTSLREVKSPEAPKMMMLNAAIGVPAFIKRGETVSQALYNDLVPAATDGSKSMKWLLRPSILVLVLFALAASAAALALWPRAPVNRALPLSLQPRD